MSLRICWSQIALQTNRVVRLPQPGDQFIIEVGLGPDDVMSAPPRPVVGRLQDARTVEPAM
jgi:hypothetical protein